MAYCYSSRVRTILQNVSKQLNGIYLDYLNVISDERVEWFHPTY